MSRSRGTTWAADVTVNGRRIRKCGFPSAVRARRYEAAVRACIESGEDVPEPDFVTGAARDRTVLDAISAAAESVWNRASTGAAAELHATAFCTVLAQGVRTPIRAVSDGHLLTWAAQLHARGNSPATINRKLSAVSAVLALAVKSNWIGRKPAIPWQTIGEGRMTTMTPEQVNRFRWALSPDHQEFMMFLLYTGMRRGEACKFTAANLVTSETLGAPRVTAVELPGDITKSGKRRTVPLTRDARYWLQGAIHRAASPSHTGPVWAHIDPDAFTAEFREVRLASPWAADDDLTPHALRHTCATNLIKAGVRPTVVQAWLGHATIDQTMAYVHETATDLQDAAESL